MWELDFKKAECQRINAFELWRRLLRVPWTPRSNQSILKEISPEYSLEGLMLKLKLQYFCHLMQRTDSLEMTLVLGKIEGGRRRGWKGMRWLASLMWWTWAPGVGDGYGSVVCCSGVAKSQTWLSEWTELINYLYLSISIDFFLALIFVLLKQRQRPCTEERSS